MKRPILVTVWGRGQRRAGWIELIVDILNQSKKGKEGNEGME
jgi:hypothetical protein